MASAAFQTEMARLRDAKPRLKVVFTDLDAVETDITAYYSSGANFQQIKERAPDEIQAGDFNLTLANHDNFFSEFIPGTLLYQKKYHGSKIQIFMGFTLPDGTIEYLSQAVGFVDDLQIDPANSTVTFRCRDRVRKILDQSLHNRPASETAVANPSNDGDGDISDVATKPFKTIDEDWTITCDLLGGDNVATFDVVGSISGNVGSATSGQEFSTGEGAGGIKFTIRAGATPWAVGDEFTFSTRKYPEWSAVNVIKIIWSVLTGYDWDSDTEEDFSDFCLGFDNTQSSANVDLDYDSFVEAIDAIDDITGFDITGYAAYDENTVQFLQGLTLLFLGSLFTGGDGRLKIKIYDPDFDSSGAKVYADSIKITNLGYSRSVDEVINYVSVHYKKFNRWEFSDSEVLYQGNYVNFSEESFHDHDDTYYTQGFSVRWFSNNGQHVQTFADQLINKYAYEPLNIDFSTGLDALETDIGDIIKVTDTKYGLDEVAGEVAKVVKQFDQTPKVIQMRLRRDTDIGLIFGFWGSRVDEGDGLSPQADTYGASSDSDKNFCYLSDRDDPLPKYRMT